MPEPITSTVVKPVEQAPPPIAAPVEEDSIISTALRYLAIVRQHLLPAAVVFVLVFVATLAFGLRQPKQYRATATIHVASSSRDPLKEVSAEYKLGADNTWSYGRYIDTQSRMVTSRQVLDTVADELDLAHDEEFLGLSEMPDGPEKQRSMAMADPVARIQNMLVAEPLRDTEFMAVHYVSGDPNRAASVANAVVDAYVAYNSATRRTATTRAGTWLEGRVQELRQQTIDAEEALLQFREKHTFSGASIEEAIEINQATILRLAEAQTEVELQRLSQESRWQGDVLDSDTASALPELVEDRVLQEMRVQLFEVQRDKALQSARYGEKHPSMETLEIPEDQLTALIDQQTEDIVEAERNGIRVLTLNEDAIGRALAREQDQAIELSRLQVEYRRLERNLAQLTSLLELVESRYQETLLASQMEGNNVSILEYARVPDGAFKPDMRLIALTGLLLAAALGVGVALLLDRLDVRVRSQGQLESELGLRVLGIMPLPRKAERTEAATKRAGSGPRQPHHVTLLQEDARHSTLAECLRTVRTNLLFVGGDRALRRILVTSASPEEGKSAFISNLAVTMAAAGKRTIMVDTDLRRPVQHKAFGLARERGQLTQVLSGEVDLPQAIVHTDDDHLDLLLCGRAAASPAELLGSRQFSRLLEQLEERYDCILLDSPPIMPVSDPIVLSQLVDAVILVVRHNVSNRHAVRSALRRLRDVEAPLAGCIYNGVDLDHPGYNYSYGYGSKYDYQYYYRSYRHYGEDEAGESSQASRG